MESIRLTFYAIIKFSTFVHLEGVIPSKVKHEILHMPVKEVSAIEDVNDIMGSK